jgi:hypothetical protein
MQQPHPEPRAASQRLLPVIDTARTRFRDLLQRCVPASGASIEQYHRYLTMQFHLTRDVQSYFLTAAGSRLLARRRALRRFLVEFAGEEELHYLVAANDLAALQHEVGSLPVDVLLWHTFFRATVAERPFLRLGAATVLESISGGVARDEVRRALSAPFLGRANSKFLVMHQHETLPHGEQLLDALDAASLDDALLDDLAAGARFATVQYLRMAEWALDATCAASLADQPFEMDALDGVRTHAVRLLANNDVVLDLVD